MSDTPQLRGVKYENVDQAYLGQRKLRKSAGWILLWALGVGAVISGDFFGWNFGLAAAGFGGLLIATVVIAVMYVCMVLCIAEMSTALPHAGGFYSFTRNAFGPASAYLNGTTDIIEYVITPAVIVVGIGGYMDRLIPGVHPYIWWALFYAVFVGINIRGLEITLKTGLVITVAAMIVLVVFYVGALAAGAFSWDLVYNIPPAPGQTTFLPYGWYGVFAALPFAIWFYLAIEQLPLAAEETVDVVRDMPRALIWGIVTLLILSVFTLVLNSGIGGGAVVIGSSGAPLEDGFRAVFGAGATTTVLTLVSLTGLIASFHAIIYAYGRVLFAQSRAGYLPRWMSVTGGNHTPVRALIIGAVIGYACAILIDQFSASVGAALLNMAVFGAGISYALVMLSYIALARKRPNLPRPYRSPLGVAGAWVGTVLAVISLVATFAIEAYRPGVWGTVAFLLVMYVYYLLYSRNRLVAQAPEEEVALMVAANKEISPHHTPAPPSPSTATPDA